MFRLGRAASIVVAALAAIALLVVPANAQAASGRAVASPSGSAGTLSTTWCAVLPFTTSCKTGTLPVPLNFVRYHVFSGGSGQGCSWRVRDVTNQNIVKSGRLGSFGETSDDVKGLTNSYRLELYNCWSGAGGDLKNSP